MLLFAEKSCKDTKINGKYKVLLYKPIKNKPNLNFYLP